MSRNLVTSRSNPKVHSSLGHLLAMTCLHYFHTDEWEHSDSTYLLDVVLKMVYWPKPFFGVFSWFGWSENQPTHQPSVTGIPYLFCFSNLIVASGWSYQWFLILPGFGLFRFPAEHCWAAAGSAGAAANLSEIKGSEGRKAECPPETLLSSWVYCEERLPGQSHLCPVSAPHTIFHLEKILEFVNFCGPWFGQTSGYV